VEYTGAGAECCQGIHLRICRECGHIFNHTFDPQLVEYTPEYENSLHFPNISRITRGLSPGISSRPMAYGTSAWSRSGAARENFCKSCASLVTMRVWAWTQAIRRRVQAAARGRNKDLFKTFIRLATRLPKSGLSAAGMCSSTSSGRSSSPAVFGARSNPAVYFEVPNFTYTLGDLGIWDLIYEHCSYFSRSSLVRLFMRNSFRVVNVSERYSGQLIGIECFADRTDIGASSSDEDIDRIQASAASFAERMSLKVEHWKGRLHQLPCAGKRTALWGGGSKGVVRPEQVGYMIDINPRKQGRYVAGTGHRIVPPNFLSEYRPDVVVIMNGVYQEEIRAELVRLDLSPELMAA
jgi:hypothetical protein